MTDTPLTASTLLSFTPPSLAEAKDPKLNKISFSLQVPTFEERDLVGNLMYRLGVRQVSTQSIRALMISELFEIMSEEEATLAADFLEGHWEIANQDDADAAAWLEQEMERLADIKEGAKKVPEQKPKPRPRTSVRDRARADNLVQQIVDSSQPVRDKLSDQQLYDYRFSMMTARLQVKGWKGPKTKPEFEEQAGAQLLTEACIEKLRSELKHAGGAWWQQLSNEAAAMYDLPESERKNSDSPPSNGSPPDGSSSESGALETSGGSSTGSNTGPAPADE